MPVTGSKPKPAGQAVTRHKQVHDWTEVENVPYLGEVPKLPARRGSWPARTKRKWLAWSTMPHCKLWGEAEWDFALDSLELAARFHEGDARVATELRNREKVLGTTADFRRDLRIRYVEPKPENAELAAVTSLDDYREL